jgi:hypothetical protein
MKMPPKGNQFKSNSFKDESRPRQGATARPEHERVIKQRLENLISATAGLLKLPAYCAWLFRCFF